MTRAGAVAEQIPVPSKVITERVREPGSQADAATWQGEVEGEFSALLSKLKSGSDGHSDQSADDLPDGSSAPTEWRGARHHTRDAGVPEVGSDGDADDGRTAIDRLPRSDIDLVDASLLGMPPKAAKTGVPATDPPEADTAAGEGIAAILTVTSNPLGVPATDPPGADAVTTEGVAANLALTSGQTPGLKAPDVSEQPSEASQRAGPSVSPKAIINAKPSIDAKSSVEANANIEANVGPETPVAAQVAPAAKGQLDQKDAVRSRAPAADAAFTSSADVPKSTMPGVVVTQPARNDLPKANVVRQEAHFAPVLPSAALSRAAVTAAAGAKLGMGSETKGNESAPLPIDPGMLPAEGTATAPVPQPAQQIANRITTEIAAFEVVDRVGVGPTQVAGKPVLKILQIQLQPAELGTVTVRMELKDAGLELHVEAARAETAEIIRGDKDTLSNLLRSSGYGIDASSIRVVDGGDRTGASPQSGQQGAQANLQSSTQSHHGGSGDDRAQRGNAGSSDGDAPKQTNRTDDHETTTSRTGGGVYV